MNNSLIWFGMICTVLGAMISFYLIFTTPKFMLAYGQLDYGFNMALNDSKTSGWNAVDACDLYSNNTDFKTCTNGYFAAYLLTCKVNCQGLPELNQTTTGNNVTNHLLMAILQQQKLQVELQQDNANLAQTRLNEMVMELQQLIMQMPPQPQPFNSSGGLR